LGRDYSKSLETERRRDSFSRAREKVYQILKANENM
jgi:hypothetical protein